MAWTPDGDSIVYWSQGHIWRVDVASGESRQIPFSVNDTRTAYPAVEVAVDVAPDTLTTTLPRFATQSPDGQSVAFESMGRLYLKRNGEKAKRLTRDTAPAVEFSPAFSPDGKEVYYLTWSDDELGSIRKVSARGGRSKEVLATPGHYVDLSVSSDGETLLFAKLSGSSLTNPHWGKNPGIYILNLSDEEAQFVSRRGRSPHFGPGDRIYVTERVSSAVGRGSDDASSELISMNHDGEDVRTHASSPLATVIRMSPAGKHVAYREAGRLYVAALPMTGRSIDLAAIENTASGAAAYATERVSAPGGEFIQWSADGSSLTWSVGPRFFQYIVNGSLGSGTNDAQQIADLSLSVDSDRPQGTVAFTNARVITMNLSLIHI